MDELVEPMDVEIVPADDDSETVYPDQTNVKTLNAKNVQSPEKQPESRYENRGGTFTTGINIFSKEEQLKMEERAKRFGLKEKVNSSLSNQEQNLYSSMGIVEENENTKNLRRNVIHMRGTEEMSTKDVFKYFEDYAPASIEWINDVSCNVVWLDNVSAARAMIGLSKKIVGLDKQNQKNTHTHDNPDEENNVTNESCTVEMEEDNDSTKDMSQGDYISIKDIDCPLPPGLWRKGIDYPKSKAILLRFATRADKKQPNAEKLSEYYKKYGNPNFGGIKGILTESRKRMYKQIRQTKKRFKEEAPEDSKDKKRVKNPWGALSESWGLNDFMEDDFETKPEQKDQGRSVKERLGLKCPTKEPTPAEEPESSDSSDSENDWCKRNKVLRMRMHADDEEEKIHKKRAKIRQQTLLNNLTRGSDLRSRLGRPRQETQFRDAIQVVVTNTNATKSNSLKPNDSEEEDGEIVEDDKVQEKEEGEWQESDGEEQEEEEEEEDYSDDDSDGPAKEVQGPKGSVIKVVQHKPRVASTVWARLNNVKSEVTDNSVKDRQPRERDLRTTLKSGDLRSRIGNHTRGRSPLRIEVKNDKYTEGSETE
ncbi:uncharacterized protein LOC143359803 isoform X1 [Halictus rubicundus]|uniref:uncharacterized protein LOC143359803 isoform X1 n=1 Tax=Halictus rubicundus TaxID=77578 RepID=UPI0040361BEB